MPMPRNLKPILKGAAFFALVGPLVGGVLVTTLIAMRNGMGPITGVSDLAMLVFFVAAFSYLFGLLPALATGLAACAAMHHTRNLPVFLGICVLASTGVSYLLAHLGFDSFSFSGKVLAALSALPALVTGGLWWKLQHRRKASSAASPG